MTREKFVLFVGFPFYIKGVDILVRAFEKICNKFPEFTLKLIGHELEEEAKRYLKCWNKRVNFCKPVFYDEIIKEFLNCYCFVLPSREEGVARVLIEAMSSGKPVIGSDRGGTPEIIKDGECGFIFKGESVEDLASKLEILLSDANLAKKMGEKGREIVKERFSSEKYCEYFTEMIKNTLND